MEKQPSNRKQRSDTMRSEASLPCVVTIQKPNYDPRYPTIKSKMAARKKPIGELETGDVPGRVPWQRLWKYMRLQNVRPV